MGSGRNMRWIQLFVLHFVVFSSWIFVATGSLEIMSAPNLLHVETTENIFVEIQDRVQDGDITVQIAVMTHPSKSTTIASTSVTLTKANNYQDFGRLKIPAEDFSKDPNIKQYVHLQARFPGRVLEKVVLVSFQPGYIFIQTNKPIYTHNSNVLYRVFAMMFDMEPKANEDQRNRLVDIEIMTPEGNSVLSEVISLTSGIAHGRYKLPDIVSYGVWKVEAKFNSIPQKTFSAEFEVKEYVASSFEVKLTPASSFFYVDSESLTVSIRAKYIFDKEVDGTAHAVFGVVYNGIKRRFPSSLQRVPIQGGHGEVQLMREHITQKFPNVIELVGSSIYVDVSVLTESGGEIVEAELRGIKIVTSPYTINFKRTPKYFKPGMSFDITIEVVNPDNTPASGVAVMVDPGYIQSFTSASGIAKVTINTQESSDTMNITARTNNPILSTERQAVNFWLLFKAQSNNDFLIGVDATEVELGDNMKVMIFLKRPGFQKDLTYLILSKGQLVKYGRYKLQGQVFISFSLPITKEMLPSFRIVAYYHTNSDEVMSDSVWVDVKDSCMGTLKLEPTRHYPYNPSRMFNLRITGDPQATVGLVAVDKSTSVPNNKNHLTQKKIWDTVEKYDTGCTPGGGKDSMNVFYDAGLLFVTNTFGTPDRTDVKCPAFSRRKRASPVMNHQNIRNKLISQYEDKEPRECCLDGIRTNPVSHTCERRSRYIVNSPGCIEAFMRCCKGMEKQRVKRKEEINLLSRSKRATEDEDDDSYMDSNEISYRTNFPESWLWTDVTLPACSHHDRNCASTSFNQHFPLVDTITTWQFTGISMSRTHGICVSDPLEVTVQKEFFIDLKLPYSAVLGEQLEIKAILHNYSPDSITVRVELREEKDVCSPAYKRQRYRQEVTVGALTTRSVPFIIIPLRVGDILVEVKAAVKDSYWSDGIMKKLRVVPLGKQVKSIKRVTLNPLTGGVGGKQVININSEILPTDVVPNTIINTDFYLTAQAMTHLLTEVISGDSMGTLIIQPSGSGEENMASMTLPVIATIYLDKTTQWNTVGLQKRNEALEHIRKGYQNELTYRKTDGSFSAFPNDKSSTWLTAYVVKVFAMAQNLVTVETSVICDAIKFLIFNTQQVYGLFIEEGNMSNTVMTGDVTGIDSDASMTAFCLIAMQETRTLCSSTVGMMSNSIARAATYLEQRLPTLINPYAVAIASYALANENKLNKEILYKFAAPEQSHWPLPKGDAYTLEATAYALLALVKAQAFEEARPVVIWLSQQQRLNGGYRSTQATMIVYQAVAEYWTSINAGYALSVEVLLPEHSLPYLFIFRRNHVTKSFQTRSIGNDVKVTATGIGAAMLEMVSLYYTLPQEKESDCDKFNMSVQVLPEAISANQKTYRLKVDVLFKDKEHDASMSILDVGLPTGFSFNKHDLDSLSSGRARIIANYKADTVLSDRGSLIIYLDKISNTQPEEISFRIHQEMKVGILQPAAVSVYEYSDKKPCVRYYHPERSGSLMSLCFKDECECAEDNCSMQIKQKVMSGKRYVKSCEVTSTFRVTFVYKVRVEEFTRGLSADIYIMRIVDVIKEGSIDVNPLDKFRTFLGYKHCKEALDLRPSKTYLIMGSFRDIHGNELSGYHYMLTEKTWIEYWPTNAECSTQEYRPTCLDMQNLVQQHATFGCFA